jgi:four helix bundle suffix protein
MVQAARSGRQNIAEGSRAGATSAKTEIRLVNVARASQDELLLDYEDFLRQHNYPQWNKDAPEAKIVRDLWKQTPQGQEIKYSTYTLWLEHENSAIIANTLICLIHQANFLLNRQLIGLERQFTQEGGFSEKMSKARANSNTELQTIKKSCPICGQPMIIRTARQGKNSGNKFLGCSNYPQCRGTVNYQPENN